MVGFQCLWLAGLLRFCCRTMVPPSPPPRVLPSKAHSVVNQAESQRAEGAWERQTRDPFLETFLFEVSLANQE